MSTNLSFYQRIQETSLELMMNAKHVANAIKDAGGTERLNQWGKDPTGLSYHRPFFRSIKGEDHTIFAIDVDVDFKDVRFRKYYTTLEEREQTLKAVLTYFDSWAYMSKFFTYISGMGLYFIQNYKDVIEPERFIDIIHNDEDDCLFPKKDGWMRTGSLDYDKWLEDVLVYIPTFKEDHKKWVTSNQDIILEIKYNNIDFILKIDLRMYQEGTRLFRVPFSPYFKLNVSETILCVPVVKNRDGSIDVNETVFRSIKRNTIIEPYSVPEFTFYDKINLEEETIGERFRIPTSLKNVWYHVEVPDVGDELTNKQERVIRKAIKLLTGDPVTTPPCIYNHFNKIINPHWSRVEVVRYLAHRGFTPNDVALFIRHHWNDDDDNLPNNKDRLIYHMPKAYGDPFAPYYPTSCIKMQSLTHQSGNACSPDEAKLCGRTWCLAPSPHDTIRQREIALEFREEHEDINISEEERLEDIRELRDEQYTQEQKAFQDLVDHVINIISNRSTNYEIIKTTRAGVTTGLMYAATAYGSKRLLVIAPTLAIGTKTFPTAIELAHKLYNTDINGAVINSNLRACLRLRFDLRDLEYRKAQEPEWGDVDLKFPEMSFHFKYSCHYIRNDETIECPYYNRRFPVPMKNDEGVPIPIIESEVTSWEYQDQSQCDGFCSYSSIVDNLDSYDVLFITYDKLNSIMLNPNEESSELVQYFLDNIDILFFDEISQFAQSSPLTIPIYKTDETGFIYHSDLFRKLDEELALLESLYDTNTGLDLRILIGSFIEMYEPILIDLRSGDFKFEDHHLIESLDDYIEYDPKIVLEDNPIVIRVINGMREDVIEGLRGRQFSAYYNAIRQITKDHNIYLQTIEKVLLLLRQNRWWFQSVSTKDNKINCTFVSNPTVENVRRFVEDFNATGKQILVTDATMPLIKMSDLFNVPFERYVIGDPRFTCERQLILSDNKNVNSNRILSKSVHNYESDLIEFIQQICRTHPARGISLILPNSRRLFRRILDLRRTEIIPRQINITYYRSDQTIGVASDRRIMIAVCAPYPPKGSFFWLAAYYKDIEKFADVSFKVLSDRLEKMNAFATFYQTIGRSKDPLAKDNSIVYLWGIDNTTVNNLLRVDDDVPLPKFTEIVFRNSRAYLLPILGKLWIDHNMVVDPAIVRVFSHITKEENKGKEFTIASLLRELRIDKKHKVTLETVDIKILEYFGIYTNKRGRSTYFWCDDN